jgi:hypothetical protein
MKWIETRLNDSPCLSANLFVLIDGNVCAGNIAKESILLLNEENGIFQWEFKNNQLIFSSFSIGYA